MLSLRFWFFLLLCAPSPAQIVLEDFSTARKTAYSDLWAAYRGEDPIQTTDVTDKAFRVTVGPPPNGLYIHFFPNTGQGYPFPEGFAQYWIKSGTWDPNVNRLRWRMKCDGRIHKSFNGYGNLQFGTYVKDHSNADVRSQGAHFYHHFDPNLYPDHWVVFEANRRPQHQVGRQTGRNWPEDPLWESNAHIHYFDGLTRFYLDSQGPEWSNRTCWVTQFEFALAPDEPEELVSSVTATYNGKAYEVVFSAPKGRNVKYDVFYSSSSMRKIGLSDATSGKSISSRGDDYTAILWTSPAMPESSMLYVAIRPRGSQQFYEIAIPRGP